MTRRSSIGKWASKHLAGDVWGKSHALLLCRQRGLQGLLLLKQYWSFRDHSTFFTLPFIINTYLNIQTGVFCWSLFLLNTWMSRAGGRNKIFLKFLDVFAVQPVFSVRKVSFAMASPFGFWSHRILRTEGVSWQKSESGISPLLQKYLCDFLQKCNYTFPENSSKNCCLSR